MQKKIKLYIVTTHTRWPLQASGLSIRPSFFNKDGKLNYEYGGWSFDIDTETNGEKLSDEVFRHLFQLKSKLCYKRHNNVKEVIK